MLEYLQPKFEQDSYSQHPTQRGESVHDLEGLFQPNDSRL